MTDDLEDKVRLDLAVDKCSLANTAGGPEVRRLACAVACPAAIRPLDALAPVDAKTDVSEAVGCEGSLYVDAERFGRRVRSGVADESPWSRAAPAVLDSLDSPSLVAEIRELVLRLRGIPEAARSDSSRPRAVFM